MELWWFGRRRDGASVGGVSELVGMGVVGVGMGVVSSEWASEWRGCGWRESESERVRMVWLEKKIKVYFEMRVFSS